MNAHGDVTTGRQRDILGEFNAHLSQEIGSRKGTGDVKAFGCRQGTAEGNACGDGGGQALNFVHFTLPFVFSSFGMRCDMTRYFSDEIVGNPLPLVKYIVALFYIYKSNVYEGDAR
ncbi:MAG: hypothetical protein AAF570_28815 [Bacteroidota bacterium]